MSGKVVAFDGNAAAPKIAKELVRQMERRREDQKVDFLRRTGHHEIHSEFHAKGDCHVDD
jgi:1,4-dihydroxy-2-naphthoyl-CoA synthase